MGGGIFKATAVIGVIGGLHYISSPNFLPCLSLYGSRKIIESVGLCAYLISGNWLLL